MIMERNTREAIRNFRCSLQRVCEPRFQIVAYAKTIHDNIDDLWAARQEMEKTLSDYIEKLDPDALDEEIEFELIGGNKGVMTRAMMLTHLFTHGSYHRGWVADMFGQIDGLIPPGQDVPVYARYLEANGAPALS